MTKSTRSTTRGVAPLLVAIVLTLAGSKGAEAQSPPLPSPSTPEPNPNLPANPPPAPVRPAPVPAPAPTSPEAALEERFRKLEERYTEMERRHDEEYKALAEKYETLQQRVGTDGDTASGAGARGEAGRTAPTTGGREGANTGGTSNSSSRANAREAAGSGAQGTGGRTAVREAAASRNTPAKVIFNEGIEFSSEDDEFKLNFHNLTQAEFRGFPSQDLGQLKDQFFIPRQRWYFSGQATKNVEFYTVINRGYGSLDLLDAFITLNVSQIFKNEEADSAEALGTGAQGTGGRTAPDRSKGPDTKFRFRVGRMKTPYLYEYYSIAEGDLIAPERSLYAGNFSGNRQVGLMFIADLFDSRVSVYGGLFNGPRRSFQDTNSDKDLFLFVNTRPFLRSEELTALKYFNIGGGVNGGFEDNPLQPSSLTTANDQTSASSNAVATSLGPAFLTYNNDVIERGKRVQWSGHMAWFYKSFMLLGEYAGGTQGYALTTSKANDNTQIPLQGWMVQATYFLTGEELTRRVNVVRPLHDFGWKNGEFGTGAIEVHARFSELDLGKQIFTAGFADPNLWSNRAQAVDTGMNWYLNYYTKIYFDWQHSFYGSPVTTGSSNKFMSTTDLFWLRFQVFF